MLDFAEEHDIRAALAPRDGTPHLPSMSHTGLPDAALADRYRIEHQVGAGGMATVYLARDLKHDREVALKVLRPELAVVLGPERFLAEIKITARLDHPHILTLIDSGAADGFLYYVLPFVRGESLREKLNRERQLGLDEALAITRQIAGALDYAHRHGVVHRDIKPENILLHEGEAMLTDFGIALAVKEAGGNRLTETGLSLGTPQYMSPEQATGDRDLDARTDIYSLAAVLYEMLAGEPPVTGPTAQAVIAKLMTERPTRLRTVRDTVPEGVDNAVARALAKVPADRFASARDFAAALTAPGGAAVGIPGLRSRTRLVVAAVAVLAVGVVGAYWALADGGVRPVPTAVQLTTTGGSYYPAISPDGDFVSYVTEACGGEPRRCRYSLVVQDLASASRPTTVAGDFAWIWTPRWSPDGARIFFVVARGDTGIALASVPRLGGTVEFHGPFAAYAVSPDGSRAIASLFGYGDSLATLVQLRPGTEEVTDSVKVPGFIALDARWSPDGRWIAVTTTGLLASRIIVLSRDLRIVDQVVEPRFGFAAPTVRWSAGSDGLYFLGAGAGGRGDLIRRTFDGRRGRFSGDGDTLMADLRVPQSAAFDVSPDASRLVYTRGQVTYELWALERPGLGGDWQARRVLTSTAGLPDVGIARDGERIAYAVVEAVGDSIRQRIYVVPFVGGDPRPVGPVFHEIRSVGWVPGVRDTLFIDFRDARDSLRTVLVSDDGGPLRPLSPYGYVVGLSGGRRLVSDLTAFPRVAWEVRGADGRPLHRRVWPDSLSAPQPPAYSPTSDLVALLSVIDAIHSIHTIRLYVYDPIADSIGPGRTLRIPTEWNGSTLWLSDGRLAFQEVPGWLSGSSNMRLRLVTLDGTVQLVEELPLPFTTFGATPDLRRAVGIVENRQSDVWLVRNFDPER